MTAAEAQATSTSQEALLATYSALAARRTAFDMMMWQVPALAMAAQAFLLTIALGSDIARLSKMTAAVLALALAGMSMQLMAKHRFLEVLDSQLIEQIETRLGVSKALGIAPHAAAFERVRRLSESNSWWVRLSSYRLWLAGLTFFALADTAAAVAAWVAT